MAKTKLKKLIIEKFRALNNVEIDFGDHITVICGKNGTSKSSILGIAAQIFSFEKDYVVGCPLYFQKITGGTFKSQYSEHFRISDQFDLPGSMQVNIEITDGYTGQTATARLELMKRGKASRPVARNNSAAIGSNTSRNFTHPVIFLSLKRLFPITDRDYNVSELDYLQKHKQEFIGLTNELLNRNSTHVTSTGGTINSAVSHGDNYDQNSVSAGEDNAGQIILALMSFKKLKEEYDDYKGGLLLIDEADAGLFPTAQINLLNILDRECRNLDLQVVMTSHSPTLIERAFEQSQEFRRRYKTVYLCNTYGDVKVMHDWSWIQISADINTKTIASTSKVSLPEINVYFEDKEAADFFNALISRQPIKKYVRSMAGVSLGCDNYLELVKKKVPEFSERSIICLDADTAEKLKNKKFKTIILLPGDLPPDQLMFQHLYNLPASDHFWINNLQFTRDVFTRCAAEVLRVFAVSGNQINVKERLTAYQGERKPREIFKRFYQNDEMQTIVNSGTKPHNPWRHWVEHNQMASNEFLAKFKMMIHNVMSSAYAVDVSKLVALDVKLKKVQ